MAAGKFPVHFLHILPLFDDILASVEHPAENLEPAGQNLSLSPSKPRGFIWLL